MALCQGNKHANTQKYILVDALSYNILFIIIQALSYPFNLHCCLTWY